MPIRPIVCAGIQSNQRELGGTVDIDNRDSPFRNNNVDLAFQYAGERTAFDVGLEWGQEDYEGRSERNRDIARAVAIVRREFTRRLSGQLNLQVIDREYSEITREDRDSIFSWSLGWGLTPHTQLSVVHTFLDRDSNLNTNEFTEQRVFLRFTYTPPWSRQLPAAGVN